MNNGFDAKESGNVPLPRLASIDSIKGVAVCLIIALHYSVFLAPQVATAVSNQISFGRVGTFLFFLVTGFTIPGSLRKPNFSTRAFLLKRVVRLLPPLWLSLLIGFPIAMVVKKVYGDEPLTVWLMNIVGLQTWFGKHSINGVTWTLGVDWLIYLVLLLLHKFAKRADYAVLLIVAGLVFGIVLPEAMGKRIPVGALSLVLASGVGYCWNLFIRARLINQRQVMIRIGGLILVATGAIIANNGDSLAYEFASFHSPRPEILGLVTAIGLFLVLTLKNISLGPFISMLGRASYSLYLFHGVGLSATEGHWAVRLGWIVLAILISALSYRFVEKPLSRLKTWTPTVAE